MWCLINQPNSSIFEVRVDPKAIGQECLERVCDHLGISCESDYFGLKYENHKGEELWLNLRNPIDMQVNSHGHTSPVRLSLRVKFWVPPHLLLQDNTKHLFYLNAKLELIEKRIVPSNWEQLAKLIALVAEAESGDYDVLNLPHHIYMQMSSIVPSTETAKPQNFLKMIALEHEKLKGMHSSNAEYWLLKEISSLEGYGEEIFQAKSPSCIIGVGPHGINIYKPSKEKQVIPFTAIHSATSHGKTMKLEYLSMENEDATLQIKMDSRHAASGLYRVITEKHAFYSCETVRSAVTEQFIRDLKGTIVSIFNEDSPLGKKYVFDIKRTCREVYDNARRVMYLEKKMYQNEIENNRNNTEGEENKNSHEGYVRIMTCKICMDKLIDTAFLPCAHVVSCSGCASRCDRCPLCRTNITTVQKIYLPGEF